LLDEIAEALDLNQDYGERSRGDDQIRAQLASDPNQSRIRQKFEAANRVREAAPLGISIDNVIHQMSDDADLVYCSKLAIVRKILEAERKCALRVHSNTRKSTWTEVKGTWLGGLAQMVVQDRQRGNLGGLFENLSIICFNYDRTIARFLPFAVASQFGIPIEQTYEITKRLRIIHPYGSIGPLEWQTQKGAVQFGAERCDLGATHQNIRTFTEQTSDESALAEMKGLLESAERIAFLGFGYIPQNMELLLNEVSGKATDVFGTCIGLSDPDRETVSGQLSALLKPAYRGHKAGRLVPLECAPFLREHFRTLTS